MIYLKNEMLTAEISEIGAEIKNLKKDGYEYMWSGDPRVWANTSPILFPMLCAVKDNKYTLDGKTYPMTRHGFLRGREFKAESVSDNSVTMLYTYNEETLKMYPYQFEFRAVFTLLSDSLKIEYSVKNLGDTEMYFSVGAHEAYATPEGVEDYDIIFPYKENLETVLQCGGLLQKQTAVIGKNTEYLPLYDKYFMLDTLIFKNLKSKQAVLRNRKTGRTVKVEFPDCPYLAIWHKPSAGYVCIEPWSGLPDNADTDYNIKTKEGIMTLAPFSEYSNIHTVTV